MITSFEQMIQKAAQNKPMRLAGAAAQDDATILAMHKAEEMGMIVPYLYGDIPTIEAVMKEHNITFKNATFVQADTMEEGCAKAVKAVADGEVDFIMKGLVDTNIFLKACLKGLPVDGLLSHVMTLDTHGAYHKLLITSDGGMCLYPTLEQKKGIIKNALQVAAALEIEHPNVSCLCAKEKVNPKMPSTVDAAELKKLGQEGYFGENVTVEGPIAFDLDTTKEAAKVKKFDSPVCGETDVFIVPNIEAGNIMGKIFDVIYGATAAGVVVGCPVPIVMSSRGDSDASKMASIAMGSLMANLKK